MSRGCSNLNDLSCTVLYLKSGYNIKVAVHLPKVSWWWCYESLMMALRRLDNTTRLAAPITVTISLNIHTIKSININTSASPPAQ